MIIVYVPCRNKEEARKICNAIVEKKLAACGNYFPITSIFRWKGKIDESDETLLLLKTTEKNYMEIEEEIKKMHSYELPCIIKIDAESSKEYAEWVRESVI